MIFCYRYLGLVEGHYVALVVLPEDVYAYAVVLLKLFDVYDRSREVDPASVQSILPIFLQLLVMAYALWVGLLIYLVDPALDAVLEAEVVLVLNVNAGL